MAKQKQTCIVCDEEIKPFLGSYIKMELDTGWAYGTYGDGTNPNTLIKMFDMYVCPECIQLFRGIDWPKIVGAAAKKEKEINGNP